MRSGKRHRHFVLSVLISLFGFILDDHSPHSQPIENYYTIFAPHDHQQAACRYWCLCLCVQREIPSSAPTGAHVTWNPFRSSRVMKWFIAQRAFSSSFLKQKDEIFFSHMASNLNTRERVSCPTNERTIPSEIISGEKRNRLHHRAASAAKWISWRRSREAINRAHDASK